MTYPPPEPWPVPQPELTWRSAHLLYADAVRATLQDRQDIIVYEVTTGTPTADYPAQVISFCVAPREPISLLPRFRPGWATKSIEKFGKEIIGALPTTRRCPKYTHPEARPWGSAISLPYAGFRERVGTAQTRVRTLVTMDPAIARASGTTRQFALFQNQTVPLEMITAVYVLPDATIAQAKADGYDLSRDPRSGENGKNTAPAPLWVDRGRFDYWIAGERSSLTPQLRNNEIDKELYRKHASGEIYLIPHLRDSQRV